MSGSYIGHLAQVQNPPYYVCEKFQNYCMLTCGSMKEEEQGPWDQCLKVLLQLPQLGWILQCVLSAALNKEKNRSEMYFLILTQLVKKKKQMKSFVESMRGSKFLVLNAL